MASFDLSLAAARTGVSRRVYLAAGAMVIAFLATIGIVIEFSTREADKFALDADMRSTSLEFDRMTQQAIREHSEIAFWNAAVEALAAKGGENMDFVQEQIADWMIDGLGYEWAFTVAPDGKAGVAVIGDQILRNPGSLSIVEANTDLTDAARRHFEAKRVRAGKGFLIPTGDVDVVRGLQATAIRTWDGMPGIAIAQVIVPETEDFAIKDGEDTVFIAFKPLTPQAISELGDRLGLPAPDVVPFVPSELPISHIVLPNNGEAPELAFRWHPHAPRPAIIRAVAPVAIGLCTLICAVLVYIVTRHGRALRALAESEERNRHMAAHDALTGLPNRHQFDQALEKLISRSDPVAIICIDLDRFKDVNDTFGHHAGDAVLRAVAQRFRDRIGDQGIVARIGGDEFIAAVTKQVDSDHLQWLGDSLVADASEPVSYHGHYLKIGASVGIAIWPRDGRAAREVITAADRFLYRSKGEGRGRTTIADGGEKPVSDRLSA
jgi:diguanylate cyclase (GGDEF)-like protein